MTERTTVVNSGGSSVAIVAIVVLALIVIVGFLYFTGAGASLFPNRIDINVNPPAQQNPPAPQPQPPPQDQPQGQPGQPNPMSFLLVAAGMV